MEVYSDLLFDPVRESNRLRKLKDKYSWALDKVDKLPVKKAAVLIAIFQHENRPHVILTERSRRLRTHAGDVALPGGKVDAEDESVEAAALREAEEEIGLMREHVQVIGTSMPVYSSIAKVLIIPVVGFIHNIDSVSLKICEDEVESVFAVPLQVFCETLDYDTFSKTRFPKVQWKCSEYLTKLGDIDHTVPLVKALFSSEKTYKVWGITAVILDVYSSMVFRRRPFISSNDSGPLTVMGKFVDGLIKTYSKSKM